MLTVADARSVSTPHNGHVRLFAGTASSGRPVYEVVPATLVEADVYEILGSPALATGCAAGDRIRILEDGHFEILTRGGNLCLVIYPQSPLDDGAVAALRAGFDGLEGVVESPADRQFIVVTVPISAGFPAVEAAVMEWTLSNGAEWQYLNVYDEYDRPLGWWEDEARGH